MRLPPSFTIFLLSDHSMHKHNQKFGVSDCNNADDCGSNAFCDFNNCKCCDGYVNYPDGECVSCDDFNKVSSDCRPECCPGYCNNNICHSSNPPNSDILLTATQIAMTGALILGILTIIALLWKMCSKTDYRRRAVSSTRTRRAPRHITGSRRSGDSTTSVGSLQRDVSERLRDAPPPYIRSPPLPPPGDMPPPYHVSQGYTNASFVGEANMPPPDYSVVIRLTGNDTNEQNASDATRTSQQEVKTEIPKQQACKETESSKSVGDVLEGSSGHI